MTIKRMLLGALAAVGLAGTSMGQDVRSMGTNEKPASDIAPVSWFNRVTSPVSYVDPVPPAATTPGAPAVTPTATDLLTAPPGQMVHPQGTVTSPWHGLVGPTGGNGPLTYDLYVRTGPVISFGGELARMLDTGWNVGGGTRVLLFNTTGDAAWALDMGLSYTYNRGKSNNFIDVNTPAQVQVTDIRTGQPAVDSAGNPVRTRGADVPITSRVRGLHRTNFSLGVGRDIFMNGPGILGVENGRNVRLGWDVGGRWGTAHVDLVPQVDDTLYTRRAGVTHSIYAAFHGNWERPMGSWILMAGFRVEYDQTWTNLVPPQGGDIGGVNLLLTSGVRF